jgi:hypothetical protein
MMLVRSARLVFRAEIDGDARRPSRMPLKGYRLTGSDYVRRSGERDNVGRAQQADVRVVAFYDSHGNRGDEKQEKKPEACAHIHGSCKRAASKIAVQIRFRHLNICGRCFGSDNERNRRAIPPTMRVCTQRKGGRRA